MEAGDLGDAGNQPSPRGTCWADNSRQKARHRHAHRGAGRRQDHGLKAGGRQPVRRCPPSSLRLSLSAGSVRDTYDAIAVAFGLAESQCRATMFRALRAETSRLVGEAGKLPVLIFDEAHHLGNNVFAEFKMLTNHRMD